jgi:hypothetical protein
LWIAKLRQALWLAWLFGWLSTIFGCQACRKVFVEATANVDQWLPTYNLGQICFMDIAYAHPTGEHTGNHGATGQPQEACRLAWQTLDAIDQVGSLYAWSELQRMVPVLGYWQHRSDVQEITARLAK